MGDKTPGQIAYEVWLESRASDPDALPWRHALPSVKDAWEAVAEAVRRDRRHQDRLDSPDSRP